MKDHVQILVCGDEQVGKSSFIGTLIARHFPREVPPVMTDVHLPPEETDDNVSCTISDCSALPRDRQQLIEKMESADSIVVLYDVTRPDTLTRLDTFWLPLIERSSQGAPVVIVRNKIDTLDGGYEGQASLDLGQQMAPLEERYKSFHMSLECSSVIQLGVAQVFHHALSAALYPIAPLYDAKEGRLRPDFERAVRRLFRIYDMDRDGVLSDNELNTFQYDAYQLYLSEEDIVALKRILEKLAIPETQGGAPLVKELREGVAGGITVEGFLRLMQLFIEKKQMQAPWKALHSNNYDDALKLSVPAEIADAPSGKSDASGSHEQVMSLSPSAESFLRRLFYQYAKDTNARSARILTEQAQAEVFSVIPEPTCAPWDHPRSREEFDTTEEGELFGRLRRAPGAGRELTVEGWLAHWQMLAMSSPSLARAHLFFVGFKGHGEDMLVPKGQGTGRRRGHDQSSLQVFVLGGRGCGISTVVKALRLGDDLLSSLGPPPQQSDQSDQQSDLPAPTEGHVAQEEEEEEKDQQQADRGGIRAEGEGIEDWEILADAEIPETCAAYACGVPDGGDRRAASSGSGSPGSDPQDERALSTACCPLLSMAVTEVPETYTGTFVDEQAWKCDLALLVIDPSSRDSVDYVMTLMYAYVMLDARCLQITLFVEDDMPRETPRLLVSCESSRGVNLAVTAAARDLCVELELAPVVMANPETGEGFEGVGGLRRRMASPFSPGTLPFSARQRRAKDLNRKLRTAAIVAALGLAVATGFYLAASSSEDTPLHTKAGTRGSGVGWEAGMSRALRGPVRAAKRAAAVAVEYWRRWRGSGLGEAEARHRVMATTIV